MNKSLERRFMVDGIIGMIEVFSSEKPTTTFLGSTDKKGYIVETTLRFLDEQVKVFTHIEPWEVDVKSIIERIEEEAKYKFASVLYSSGKLKS